MGRWAGWQVACGRLVTDLGGTVSRTPVDLITFLIIRAIALARSTVQEQPQAAASAHEERPPSTTTPLPNRPPPASERDRISPRAGLAEQRDVNCHARS